VQINRVVPKGQFAVINGQKIYYERYGSGRPLMILHGGINSIQSSFKNQIEYFAARREIRWHRASRPWSYTDSAEDFSYFRMAKDAADLLRSLNISNADFMSWSDGGILALLIANRPNLCASRHSLWCQHTTCWHDARGN
jgi:pimeloyl-ACP methyl ester carboxylesterase